MRYCLYARLKRADLLDISTAFIVEGGTWNTESEIKGFPKSCALFDDGYLNTALRVPL